MAKYISDFVYYLHWDYLLLYVALLLLLSIFVDKLETAGFEYCLSPFSSLKSGLGTVAHNCNLSALGGLGGRVS